MVKIIGIILMVCAFQLNAAEWTAAEGESQKVYIDSSQVMFDHNTIFVNLGGEFISVDALYAEANGLHIRKDPDHNRWFCPICNFNNNGWDKTCQRDYGNGKKCGHPRPW